jgi:hypothetical protein
MKSITVPLFLGNNGQVRPDLIGASFLLKLKLRSSSEYVLSYHKEDATASRPSGLGVDRKIMYFINIGLSPVLNRSHTPQPFCGIRQPFLRTHQAAHLYKGRVAIRYNQTVHAAKA